MATPELTLKLVTAISKAAETLAEAVKNEMSLEHGRQSAKMAAVERIVKSGDNPLTGKPHSFSSAELLAERDPTYADYLAKVREAAENRILARGHYDAAVVEAQLIAGNG